MAYWTKELLRLLLEWALQNLIGVHRGDGVDMIARILSLNE